MDVLKGIVGAHFNELSRGCNGGCHRCCYHC